MGIRRPAVAPRPAGLPGAVGRGGGSDATEDRLDLGPEGLACLALGLGQSREGGLVAQDGQGAVDLPAPQFLADLLAGARLAAPGVLVPGGEVVPQPGEG